MDANLKNESDAVDKPEDIVEVVRESLSDSKQKTILILDYSHQSSNDLNIKHLLSCEITQCPHYLLITCLRFVFFLAYFLNCIYDLS